MQMITEFSLGFIFLFDVILSLNGQLLQQDMMFVASVIACELYELKSHYCLIMFQSLECSFTVWKIQSYSKEAER